MKALLLRLLFLLSQFGFDPLRLLKALRGISAYLYDLRTFRRNYSGPLRLMPCLHDRFEESGATKSEYFWQDLSVARWIYEANPRKHVDVGSRMDGFVAHVASFRELEVIDVRPITTTIPGVRFRQIDMMSPDSIKELTTEAGGGYCDSLSCLHVLEHFGLGRYGDPVDAQGYLRGFANLATLLQPQGTLYLSTPLGRERVEFNANWVFDPRTILALAASHGLVLDAFWFVDQYSGVKELGLETVTAHLEQLARAPYHLGIMQFVKQG